MKVLYYVLLAAVVYLGFCAFNDLMHLRPFSAIVESLLALGAYILSEKYKPK